MKITYLNHSGYVLEIDDRILVFDYYEGSLPKLPETARVYVFASHVHYDHFNKQIFERQSYFKDIHFILSDDIEAEGPEGSCTYIGPCQELTLDGMRIRTLRSTDEGVAFLVKVGEKTIYHGGDLNWWHWEEESGVYNEMMRRRYQREIEKLAKESIDVAFLPLDPRQEEQYAWGFDYFMRHTHTGCAFPMHLWGKYETCDRLLEDPVSEPYRERVRRITKFHQRFEI